MRSPPITRSVSASVLFKTRSPEGFWTAACIPTGRPPALDVLIALRTWAGVMLAAMVTVVPLIVNVPPLTMRPGSAWAPVTVAGASSRIAAPVPMILAFCGGMASGLAMKLDGVQQFRARYAGIVRLGERIARQIGVIVDRGRGLGRKKIVLELQGPAARCRRGLPVVASIGMPIRK